MDKDIIKAKSLKEADKIHNDPKYMYWPCEYINGEYVFYSPNSLSGETVSFYHGGALPNISLDDIDVFRKSIKQGGNYAGFYMFGPDDFAKAERYANQANDMFKTTNRGVAEIKIDLTAKMCFIDRVGQIDRLTKEDIDYYRCQGYDILKGRSYLDTEYVLLNKNKVVDVIFHDLEKIDEEEKTR